MYVCVYVYVYIYNVYIYIYIYIYIEREREMYSIICVCIIIISPRSPHCGDSDRSRRASTRPGCRSSEVGARPIS